MTPPRFSVLLPTKNRLDLLKGAIDTVRAQKYGDWEIVVADNCSEDDVRGYVLGLDDARIVYTRSDEPLPVTDNWNRALDRSTGSFVVMLGDDDGLVPGYFEHVQEALGELNVPEMLYVGAYHFAFPGVIEVIPDGMLTDVTRYYSILRDCPTISMLAKAEADAAARAALNLTAVYAFNMQHFLISRRLIDRLKATHGPFFQCPFPDFYAANMMLLESESIGRIARPLVIIGISPKSYGYFHFNDKEAAGAEFLQIDRQLSGGREGLAAAVLPGSNMNTSWLLSVAPIPAKLGRSDDLEIGMGRYRRLQILNCIKISLLGGQAPGLTKLWSGLSWQERAFGVLAHMALLPCGLLPARYALRWGKISTLIARQYGTLPPGLPAPVVGKYQTMMEVFEGLRTADSAPGEMSNRGA